MSATLKYAYDLIDKAKELEKTEGLVSAHAILLEVLDLLKAEASTEKDLLQYAVPAVEDQIERLQVLEGITCHALRILHGTPAAILQTNLAKQLMDEEDDAIREALYLAAKAGLVDRTRKGRSYLVTITQKGRDKLRSSNISSKHE